MVPRSYLVARIVCFTLALIAASVGPIVAIRVLESADARGARASAQITALRTELTRLNAELEIASSDRAALRLAVNALSTQIQQLGGTPLVPVPASTSPPMTQPPPAPTTTTTRPRTTTTTTTSTTTTVPSPLASVCQRLHILPC